MGRRQHGGLLMPSRHPECAADMVDALARAFPLAGPESGDPRSYSAMITFKAPDGYLSIAPLSFGEIADALADAGFVLVPEELP